MNIMDMLRKLLNNPVIQLVLIGLPSEILITVALEMFKTLSERTKLKINIICMIFLIAGFLVYYLINPSGTFSSSTGGESISTLPSPTYTITPTATTISDTPSFPPITPTLSNKPQLSETPESKALNPSSQNITSNQNSADVKTHSNENVTDAPDTNLSSYDNSGKKNTKSKNKNPIPVLNADTIYLEMGRKNKSDLVINNMQPNWVTSFISSNKNIADVDINTGTIYAMGIGNAKITATITDNNGDSIATLCAQVIIRDSISKIYISNKLSVDYLEIDQPFDFNANYITFLGSTNSSSSVIHWFVDDKSATINANGEFSASKAGIYNVYVMSFPSEDDLSKWLHAPSANVVYDKCSVVVVSPINFDY